MQTFHFIKPAMHRLFSYSLLFLSLNVAANPPDYLGAADCRIVDTSGLAGTTATWEGACKDGYAEGKGALLWFRDGRQQDIYEGQLVRGIPTGQGHLYTAGKVHFIGTFAEGKLHGPGTRADSDGNKLIGNFKAGRPVGIVDVQRDNGDRYHGEWDAVHDLPDGEGSMDYALGGRYEGQWRGWRATGIGKVTYPNGIVRQGSLGPEHVKRTDEDVKFSILDEHRSQGTLSAVATGFVVPPALPYSSLNKEQQAVIRSYYLVLQDDDTPPYLWRGQKDVMRVFAEATRLSSASGDLWLNVLIDGEGKPVSVTMLKKPSEDVAQYAASLLMRQKYTPAVCGGQPCAMSFPFRVKLH